MATKIYGKEGRPSGRPSKALAKTKPKTRSAIAYQPPPERGSYKGFVEAPGLDPQTRQVLVHLEQHVHQFRNLEERIHGLKAHVIDLENGLTNATATDTWWERLQFTVTTLQKEFHDRMGLLDRSFDAVQNLVARMDRLEKRIEALELRTPTKGTAA